MPNRTSKDGHMGLVIFYGVNTVRNLLKEAESAQLCLLAAAVVDLMSERSADPSVAPISSEVSDLFHDILLLHEALHTLRSVVFGGEHGVTDMQEEESAEALAVLASSQADKKDVN